MKIRDGPYPFIIIFYIILFIWTMKVGIVQSKPHKDDLNTQFYFQDSTDGNTATSRTGIGVSPFYLTRIAGSRGPGLGLQRCKAQQYLSGRSFSLAPLIFASLFSSFWFLRNR